MATTMFFEEEISDKDKKEKRIDFEFGRSSYYGENLIYIRCNDTVVIVDKQTGKRIADAMSDLSGYLGYDK